MPEVERIVAVLKDGPLDGQWWSVSSDQDVIEGISGIDGSYSKGEDTELTEEMAFMFKNHPPVKAVVFNHD